MTLRTSDILASRRGALKTLSLGLLAAFWAACENLDNFDVDVDAQATIPPGTIIDELIDKLDFNDLQSIDLTQELKNQGVTKDDVDSVHLTRFELSIVGPAGANFDFLDAISFYVETDGEPRLLVAKLDPVPTGATKIALEAQADAELVPYVVAPKMRMVGEVKGKRPSQETTVSALVTLDVDVRVTGC